jgi:hypothetical protein
LLPLWIFLTAVVFGVLEWRHYVRLILSSLAGVALGLSWSFHEASIFGQQALREHYLGEIASRSGRKLPWLKAIFGYPLILLSVFQPVVIPGAAGVVRILKSLRERKNNGLGILLIWILFPLIFYNLSGTRSSRYIFPIFPPLALCAGYWLESFSSRFASISRRLLVPATVAILAALSWFYPAWIWKDENGPLKHNVHVITERIPAEESIPYFGSKYWEIANPLLYYADRQLLPSSSTPAEAAKAAEKSGILVLDRASIPEVLPLLTKARVLLQAEEWTIVASGD